MECWAELCHTQTWNKENHKNEGNPKNEDNPRNKDNPKYEDASKNEDEDNLRNTLYNFITHRHKYNITKTWKYYVILPFESG